MAIAFAVGAGGGCLNIFTLLYLFSPFSPSFCKTARYRLKYCLKGPLNPKQPTNQNVVAVLHGGRLLGRICFPRSKFIHELIQLWIFVYGKVTNL